MLTRTLGDTLANNYFHLIGGQSGPVNYRRRVSSAGSDGPKASETIWWRRGVPTWLPWFASASGACRAPDDRLGIRASVSGSERANGAVDEPCRSRCVQNSGGFIIWRAAYLRTSAPPKPPASHGRTAVSRTLFASRGHLRTSIKAVIRVITKTPFLSHSRPWRSRTVSSGRTCCTDRERAHPLYNFVS